MEIRDIQETTAGYSERVSRIALFDSLYELSRKNKTDLNGKPIDMKGLGLLTLLFFFEQKLMRNMKTGVKDLSLYLQQVSDGVLALDSNEFDEIARNIIQTFRPSTGKKREYAFFNWETKQHDEVFYSILKANSFDMKTNTQYYTLDEDGLELVFATKEFYSEFQLSINQLMLRKQLEKGEFKGALRQINEMRIDVEALQERMTKLQHEIKRNIVSEETLSRYKGLLEDIYYRLQRENEEFEELHVFVNETKNRVYYENHQLQEVKSYGYILEISKELEEVHAEHTKLLQQSIEMKNQALQAAQESLYYMGIESFNFDQEITSRMISTPLPLESMKGILAPFLHVHESKQWSLFTIFSEQNVTEEKEGANDDTFLDIEEESERIRYLEIQQINYKKIVELLLETLQARERTSITLQEFIDDLIELEQAQIVQHRFFYDFWILLHQRSPIQAKEHTDEGDETNHLVDEILRLLGNQKIVVTETKELLQITERYSIHNMKIEIGERIE